MARNPDVRALKKLKKTKRRQVAAEKPRVSQAREAGRQVAVPRSPETSTETGAPVIIPASYEHEVLGDGARFFTEKTESYSGESRISRRRNQKGVLAALRRLFDTLRGRRSKEDEALAFAVSPRRSKRERKRRQIIIASCTAVLLVAVSLLVAFAPEGTAVSGQPSATPSASLAQASSEPEPDTDTHLLPVTLPDLTAEMPDLSVEASTEATEEALPTTPPEEAQALPTTPPEETPLPTTPPEETPPPITIDECIKYFVVEADVYYNDIGYSTNHYDYTDDELYMLAQVIDGEARGESFTGKVAVGNVVMNRVLNRYRFDDTIAEVITAPGQFTGYSSSRSPSSSSKSAARAVLEKEYWVIPQNVYYFRSGASAGEDWSSHKFYTEIGGHCFYTHNYSGRYRGDKVPPALFERTYKYPQYGCKPENRVYRIQYMLNKLGFDVKADKYYGIDTVKAVKLFQETHGLKADGIAGPATLEELIDTFGLLNYYKTFIAD